MLLTFADLEHKSDIQNILRASFEYLICCIGETVAKSQKPEILTLQNFNELNNLTIPKLIAFPFFVSLSNGHSNSLYHLFGEFYSLSYSPASIPLFSLWKEDEENSLRYFSISEENPLKITIKDIENFQTFSQIKETILAENIDMKNESVAFRDVLILSDAGNEKSIAHAIESGILAINSQSGNTFFNSSIDQISLQASYFDIFVEKSKADKIEIISYTDVKDNEKPFFEPESEKVPQV